MMELLSTIALIVMTAVAMVVRRLFKTSTEPDRFGWGSSVAFDSDGDGGDGD